MTGGPKIYKKLWRCPGLVVLWWCCDTLCTCSFVDGHFFT